MVNTLYSFQFQYSDGPGSPTWSISSPPPGLSLDSSRGVLIGTPTATGTYNFTVQAMQSGMINGIAGTPNLVASKAFLLNINSTGGGYTGGLTITTTSLAPGGTGQNYMQTVAATGGTPPYSFSATGLPGGLSISSNSGMITGIPTANGSYTVGVTVMDSAGAQVSQSYPVTILSTLTIVTTKLINGSNGESYFQPISAVGRTPALRLYGNRVPGHRAHCHIQRKHFRHSESGGHVPCGGGCSRCGQAYRTISPVHADD